MLNILPCEVQFCTQCLICNSDSEHWRNAEPSKKGNRRYNMEFRSPLSIVDTHFHYPHIIQRNY